MLHVLRQNTSYNHHLVSSLVQKTFTFKGLSDCSICNELRRGYPFAVCSFGRRRFVTSCPSGGNDSEGDSNNRRWGHQRRLLDYAKTEQLKDLIFNIEQFHKKISMVVAAPGKSRHESRDVSDQHGETHDAADDTRHTDVTGQKWREKVGSFRAQMEEKAARGASKKDANLDSAVLTKKKRAKKSNVQDETKVLKKGLVEARGSEKLIAERSTLDVDAAAVRTHEKKHRFDKRSTEDVAKHVDNASPLAGSSAQRAEKSEETKDVQTPEVDSPTSLPEEQPSVVSVEHSKEKKKKQKSRSERRHESAPELTADIDSLASDCGRQSETAGESNPSAGKARRKADVPPDCDRRSVPRSLSAMLHVEHMQEVALPGVGSLHSEPLYLADELRTLLGEHLMGCDMERRVRDYLWRRSGGGGGTAVYTAAAARLWGQDIAQLGGSAVADGWMGEPAAAAATATAATAAMDAARQDAHNMDVAAYVDVCIHTGMLKKAQSLLTASFINRNGGRYAPRSKPQIITDVKIYNALMQAWAKHGRMEPIRRLLRQMDGQDIAPTLQSYAAGLEALGRQAVFAPDVAARLLSDIQEAGFDLENICNICHFHNDEWINVEKTIKTILPSFRANPAAHQDDYDCPLLDVLNTTSNQPRPNPWQNLLSSAQMERRMQAQIAIEMGESVNVTSIEPPMPASPSVLKAKETLDNVKAKWRAVLTDSLKHNVQFLEIKAKGNAFTNLLPYMKILESETYVDLMMQEIELLGMEMAWFSPTLNTLQTNLGRRIRKRFVVAHQVRHSYVEKLTRTYRKYLEATSTTELRMNHRQIWQHLLWQDNDGTTLENQSAPWPYQVSKAVGKFLYGIILADVKIDSNCLISAETQELPAFYTVFRPRMQQLHEEIKPHPVLVKLYKEAGSRQLTFDPEHLPSVTPPLPWTTVASGGSLLASTELLKHAHNSPQQVALLAGLPSRQLYGVFDALNMVSACPWIINKPVLDTVIGIFNSGGDPHLDVPPPMSACPEPPIIRPNMKSDEKLALMAERDRLLQRRKEMFSLWCTELYRLSIANKYRDEIFWFPHNMDFRGRLYACPPHFNHLGSDLARSLLVFAQGRPLGPRGLDWVKVHLINLTGLKKRSSNAERLEYANGLMAEILDSADNPLTGRKWWQNSDEPWQTLACCQELARATRAPDPATYISHFPVHQDGSCNGLQHYAALARDQAGAESVNLSPFSVPKDVYSDVVEKVERERREEAASGLEIAQVLDGFVSRKVIKQTIMTTVYGVTRYGARQQIRRQLDDIADFPQRYSWEASFYLTDKTFKSLQEMFSSTKEIQDWLVLSAKLISKVCLEPVEWLTPIGWPVVQPYFRQSHLRKASSKAKSRRLIVVEKPNAVKQKNAFPPNFIHSLDSSHMMLTAIYCLRAGISFVSVHDCFWTHACDVETMNKICREQFVALHSQPILEQLAKFMLHKFGYKESQYDINDISKVETMALVNHVLGRVPNRGSFRLQNVLDSTYFFS